MHESTKALNTLTPLDHPYSEKMIGLRDRAPFLTRGSRLQPIYLEVDNKIRYSDFDQTKHLGVEEIMNKVAVMHRDMNEEQRWLMETNRERLPEYAEIAMDLQISVRYRDDYVHEFIGSELPNIAIKRLLGRSRSAMDNWLDDNIMNYYFSLVAHIASLQSILSFMNGDAITKDKE